MGVLRWSPSEFWRATPWDLYLAVEGWQESQGVTESPDVEAAITPDELRDLMEQFPDG